MTSTGSGKSTALAAMIDQAVAIASEIDADRTYFVHMSHDLAHEATQATLPEGCMLAYDGLTLG